MKQKLEGSAQEQYVRMLAKSLDGVQKMRIQTGNRIKAFEKNHGEKYGDVVDGLKSRLWAQADLMEKNIAKDLAKAVSTLPVIKWLEQVKGIGPRLTGALVGVLAPIPRYPNVSALWSFTGYGVVTVCEGCVNLHLVGKERSRFLDRQTKRRWEVHITSDTFLARVDRVGDDPDKLDKFMWETAATFRAKEYETSEGHLCSCEVPELKQSAPNRKYYGGLILPYSPFLKATCWRIASQFVRQGDFYREKYDEQKLKYEAVEGLSKGLVENRARRAMIKLFLSHLWEMWRKSEGLPTGGTYLQERLGAEYAAKHTLIAPPYADTFDPE